MVEYNGHLYMCTGEMNEWRGIERDNFIKVIGIDYTDLLAEGEKM